MITIVEKMKDFLEHTVNAFKDQNINEARQAAEAFCKIVILKEYGEIDGTKIIEKTHPSITNYSFDEALKSIIFGSTSKSPLIKNRKIKSYLLVLQNNGNPSSHDDDTTKLEEKDKLYTLLNLAYLTEWLYKDYIQDELPSGILHYTQNVRHDLIEPLVSYKEKTHWHEMVEITNNFSATLQRYVLISDRIQTPNNLENLAYIPWTYVADFDSGSDTDGLLSQLDSELAEIRDINRLAIDNPLEYKKNTVFWDFVNGFDPVTDTLTNNIREWQRKYVYNNKLKKHLEALYKGGISTSDIYLVVFWEDKSKLHYVIEFLNLIDNSFTNETTVFFCSTEQEILEQMNEEKKNYEHLLVFHTYDFSINHFSMLVHNSRKTLSNHDIILPAIIEGQETDIAISNQQYLKYNDSIEVFGKNPILTFKECNTFYRGDFIDINYLNQDCDIKRDIKTKIDQEIFTSFKHRDSKLIYLLSEPSAGSSTLTNRILWDIKDRFPSIHILKYTKNRTYEFIHSIYTETSKPILINIDHNIKEDAVKNLISELNTKSITFVILYTIRFLNKEDLNQHNKKLMSTGHSVYTIIEKLSQQENNAIFNKLSQLNQTRRPDLVKLNTERNNSLFKYCFTAFLDQYNKLDGYIESRIVALEGHQQKRLKILALIQYFIGDETNLYFLTNKTQKHSLFKESDLINSLLIYNEYDDEITVKIIHNLISEKILIHFSEVQQEKAWKQKLINIAIDFIEFITEQHTHDKDNAYILEIVNRLFIKRTVSNYDSEDQGPIRHYTDLMEALSVDSKEIIFTKLAELYPENSHIQAHLGRFFSVDRQNLKVALEYIDKAILIASEEGNNDSILFHMKGMAYFRAMKFKIRTGEDINEILPLAKEAANYFILSRESDTLSNNEYPFISHGNLLIALLRYGIQKFDSIDKFIQVYKNDDFIVDIIDDLESLISDFEVISNGKNDFDEMKQIQNQLWELQGDISSSLSMLNNMLDTNNFYNPSIRRNIVRLNIKKYENIIDNIPHERASQLLSHLKNNLDNISLKDLNSADLLLWLKLIRHKNINVNILDILDILNELNMLLKDEAQLNKVQKDVHILVVFYLYILKFLQYYNGNNELLNDLIQLSKSLKSKAVFIEGNSFPREWLSNLSTPSMKKIINRYDHKLTWDHEGRFFNKQSQQYLELCTGTIHEIKNQKAGTILYKNLHVFFVPRGEFTKSDLHKSVEFFLSFSYDGLQAWSVKQK